MELRTLRAFVEVVRQGGFSKAAKVVCATQSTISKAVKQLEDELGVTLLDRLGHRSTLTAAGEVVYRGAVKILAQREDLFAELGDLDRSKPLTLRLGLPAVGSTALFAPLFSIYRDRHPRIDIRLIEDGNDRLEEILRAGEIDLAASLLPVSEEFDWQPVRREPLVALLAANHALAQNMSITLADLKHVPFVLFESGFTLNHVILQACRHHGFEPTVAARSSQIDFLVELAAAGLGVAFLPRLIAQQRSHPAVGQVLLGEPQIDWNMAMVWRRGGYLSPAAQAWLQIAREVHLGG